MRFSETGLKGAFLVEPERLEDERGFFARTWAPEEFAARGLNPSVAQCAISFSRRRGTLRGMHYQAAPYAQAKLVRCTRGAICDVILDLRPDSGTFKRWVSVELTAENRLMLYVPEGLAHGYQSLEDASEVSYHMSAMYHPPSERGVRWDDPAFRITWPPAERTISARDLAFPPFSTS